MKFSTNFISADREYSTFEVHVPAPYLRREFELKDAKKAEITVCGLGFYKLFVNGKDITRGHLSPYISNPDHFLYFDNYDLTPYINNGKNVIGLLLGNGQLDAIGGQVWDLQITPYRAAPKAALTFEAVLENGERTEFDALSGFKCAPSPITFDDMRIGEFYDARLEKCGWNDVGYDDSDWTDAIKVETPRGKCLIADIDPVLPMGEFNPISITPDAKVSGWSTMKSHLYRHLTDDEYFGLNEADDPNGGYMYEFERNMAGIIRLNIKNAKPGQRLLLQFGEKLFDDGGLDMRAMQFLPPRFDHRIIYTCKGGDEVYTPSFTYFGFKYVIVKGIDEAQAVPELLTAIPVNTDIKQTGEFSCSDEVTNKLWACGVNSVFSNFVHYPTDCPHREKLGWMNDAATSAEHVTMFFTPDRNYREWTRQMRAAMTEEGQMPGIVPTAGWGYAWGSGPISERCLVYITYYNWLYRGETTLIKENATAILRYINYVSVKRNSRGLVELGLGDWMQVGTNGASNHYTPVDFTDTAMCVDLCRKAAKLYEVIGMKAQQDFANAVADELRAALRKYYINTKTLTVKERNQTSQALAIRYDIFDEAEKAVAFERLVDIIENDDEYICTGMIGLQVIFDLLSEYGRTDLAFKMITRPEFPSYGNWIKNGATAMIETFLPYEGQMNSLNHHIFSHIMAWFVKRLVGILPNPYLENANEVTFAPKFIDALDNAQAKVKLPVGEVSAEWHREGEDILYTVTVPEGAAAELCLEAGWQTSDGFTWRPAPVGTTTFRLIYESKRDSKRISSVR